MPVEAKLPRDPEEIRLLESYAPLDIQEKAAAYQLSHPSHSMLYPEYKQLAETLETIQVKGAEKKCVVKEYRQRTRDRERLAIWTQKCRPLFP